MANYDNDEIDDDTLDETEEEQAAEGEAAPAGNRNLLTAIGILGGIFLLLLLALLGVAFLRRQTPASPPSGGNIALTNAVIETANAGTAAAATQSGLAAAKLLTPSVTPTLTVTPTVTKTSVLAASSTPTGAAGGGAQGGGLTPTSTGAAVGQVDTRTATVAALLTQRAQTSVAQTQAKTSGTPAKTSVKGGSTTGTPGMPQSGFADEVGLPGLVAVSVGLIIVIILVRRLRLSTSG